MSWSLALSCNFSVAGSAAFSTFFARECACRPSWAEKRSQMELLPFSAIWLSREALMMRASWASDLRRLQQYFFCVPSLELENELLTEVLPPGMCGSYCSAGYRLRATPQSCSYHRE